MPALRAQVLVALGAVYLWNGEGEDVTADLNFDLAMQTVFQHEGGLVDDPTDPGGLTNFGISLANHPGMTADQIRALTKEAAAEIYKSQYYDPYRWRDLPIPLLVKGFDISVDIGAHSAIVCLQRACRACKNPVQEDGNLGSITLQAVGQSTVNMMLPVYRSELAAHYRLVAQSNPNQAKDLAGWLNRAYS